MMLGTILCALILGTAGAESKSVRFTSKVLAGNPLKDAVDRSVFVVRPSGTEDQRLPLVIYLPGFGGSSDDAAHNYRDWEGLVERLHEAKADVVLAVIDGRNRYGCSQYINSASSGRYEDYICDELAPFLEKKFNCGGSAADRMIVGHSSGGFGALRLGMSRQSLFGGVVALSPDSYFDVTHKPLALDPSTKKAGLERIEHMMPPELGSQDGLEGEAGYCLALCADYAPREDGSGKFEWLYDGAGNFRDEVYDMWLDNDPAVLAARRRTPFGRLQRVYLDGAAQDDFKANLGAQKVAEVLKGKRITSTLYFPPGHHSDFLFQRIERGIHWILHLRTFEIR